MLITKIFFISYLFFILMFFHYILQYVPLFVLAFFLFLYYFLSISQKGRKEFLTLTILFISNYSLLLCFVPSQCSTVVLLFFFIPGCISTWIAHFCCHFCKGIISNYWSISFKDYLTQFRTTLKCISSYCTYILRNFYLTDSSTTIECALSHCL